MNPTESPLDNDDSLLASGSVTHWLNLFRAGNDEAARRLWDRYFAALVSVARAKLGAVPGCLLDAEDVALSAFHALYRAASANRLPDMNDRDGLWQSLLLITSGKAIDSRRKAVTQKRGGGYTQVASELIDLAVADAPDPAMAAILSEQFESLLNLLEERELQEIALLKLEGFTNEEIAIRLNCSVRTIKRRLGVIRRTWEENGMALEG